MGYEIWLTGDPSELFALKNLYKAGNHYKIKHKQRQQRRRNKLDS